MPKFHSQKNTPRSTPRKGCSSILAYLSAIFQRTMETVLQGIPNTCVYLDDILITGESDEQDFGQGAKPDRLKKEKCATLSRILGSPRMVPQTGALRDAPVPRNVSQLLGMLNYYNKFLPNHSHNLAPLHKEEHTMEMGSRAPGRCQSDTHI